MITSMRVLAQRRDEPASRGHQRPAGYATEEKHAKMHCCIPMGMIKDQPARAIAAASQQSRARTCTPARVKRAMYASAGWPLRCRAAPSTGTDLPFVRCVLTCSIVQTHPTLRYVKGQH